MSVKSRFCVAINRLKEEEMSNFIEAYSKKDLEKASRTLESLGFISELSDDICELKPRKT